MTIRVTVSMAVCVAAVLAARVLAPLPAPAAAVPRTDSTAQPGPVDASSLLHQPGTHVRLPPGAPALPGDVSALSWLVSDADTGAVVAARDAHRRLPPASTIKTLFALTALPRVSAHSRHQVTGRELAGVGEGSSLVGVKAGRTYQVADLWRGVFLSSGNDAVHVLASMNGGWTATARQMQAKARALGARDTQVVSPDGYDAPGQVSSAYDLALFAGPVCAIRTSRGTARPRTRISRPKGGPTGSAIPTGCSPGPTESPATPGSSASRTAIRAGPATPLCPPRAEVGARWSYRS